jgi:hypothetical protein
MAINTTFNCRFPYSQKGMKEKACWILSLLNECIIFKLQIITQVSSSTHVIAVTTNSCTSLQTKSLSHTNKQANTHTHTHTHTHIQLSGRSHYTSVDDLGRDFLHLRCASSEVNTGIRWGGRGLWLIAWYVAAIAPWINTVKSVMIWYI